MKIRKIIFVLIIYTLMCLVLIGCCSSYSSEAIAKSEAKDNASRVKALAELEKRVLKLKAGSTIQDTQKAFGSKGTGLCTIQKNGHDYLCMILPVGKGYGETGYGFPYHVIFEDKKLYSIIEKLPYRWEPKKNNRDYYVIPTDPNIIFSTKALFGQELVDSIRKNFPMKKYESNLPTLFMVYYLVGPIMSKVLPDDCNCN